MHTEKPKIFISHSWTNKPLVRQLENELIDAGAEVWVDHRGIRGGDNLPEEISNALQWCNTLVLVWSEAASDSYWVKLEWTNALSLQKKIIPCRVDKTQLPPILAHKAYIDLLDISQGFAELKRALNIIDAKPESAVSAEPEVIRVQGGSKQQIERDLALSSTQEKLIATLSDETLPRSEIFRRLVSIFGSETRPAQVAKQLDDLIQKGLISQRKSDSEEIVFQLTHDGRRLMETSERLADVTISKPSEESVTRDNANSHMFLFPCSLSSTPSAEWIEIFNQEWARRNFPYFREATIQNKVVLLRCPSEEFRLCFEHLVFDVSITNRKYRELIKRRAETNEALERDAEEQNLRDHQAISDALKD